MNRTTPLTIVTALLCSVPLAAWSVDYPTLKPGQWEMTSTTDRPGAKPNTSIICFDAALQKDMVDMGNGMRKEMCSKSDIKRVGAQYITDTECRLGNSVVKAHAVMTMKGDSAYRTEASATYDPPLMNDLKQSKTVVDARFVGPCRDGLVPGDILTGTGQKINIRQLQQDRAARGK